MTLNNLIGFKPPKNITELISKSIKLDAPFQYFATVYIKDKDGVITGIKQSKRNNLIVNNFGLFLAGLMRPTHLNIRKENITFIDDGGVNREINTYGQFGAGTITFNASEVINGTMIKVGSGVTAATLADIAIETPFGTAPEDGYFNTGNGAYAAGVITLSGAIVAGAGGTINETGFFGKWYNGAIYVYIMFFHDILASGEAFLLGETITVTYTINI